MYGQRYSSEMDKIQVLFKQLLKGYHPVNDGISHRSYQGAEIKGDIGGLLERDVVQYYQLDGKYDSPLKLKVFKQSQEYNNLLNHLEKERLYLLADTFYVTSKIPKTNYDLNEKAFFFEELTNSIVYTTTHFVSFYDLGVVVPLLTKRGVKVEVEDENIALEVENNYQDCRLIYIFTFDEELSEQHADFPIGKMQKLLLVNVKNGKVYYSKAMDSGLVQYEHDIYVINKNVDGYDFPVKYFLKKGDKMIELAFEDELDDYKFELDNSNYYVFGVDGNRYLINFKPERAVYYEKIDKYFAKCEVIAEDFKHHPENYQDVTIVEDDVVHSYIDKTGFEWVYETEGLPYYMLEEEGVYMILDEYKFVRKK